MGNVSRNMVESIQGHFRAITRVMLWNAVMMGIEDHGGKVTGSATFLWGIAPTFAKDFRNTHARVELPTISSVGVAPRQPRNSRGTTQSRGTPMDTGDSRGTRFHITNLITAYETPLSQVGAGRGSSFGAAKKAGAINHPFKNFPKGLSESRAILPHPLVLFVADELALTRPTRLSDEHEVHELLGDSEEGCCVRGGVECSF